MPITLRDGTKEDLPEVLELIKELALYERAPEQVTISLQQLEEDGYGTHPLYWVILAEEEGRIVGMSLYYIRYSTWKGKCLYLEDIIVKEADRGKGAGKMLFDATITAARDMDAKLMVWQVLDWNTPSIEFYEKYGAELDGEWINGKLTYDQIQTLA